MWLLTERRLAKARAAWKCGQLERARELTDHLLAENPGLVEALLLAAKVLHESGESAEALGLLKQAEGPRARPGFAIHGALITYDQGEESSLSDALDALGPSNRLAPALRALQEVRRNGWERAVFAKSALWNPEILGRLLALLETRHAGTVRQAGDTFHRCLFAPGGAGREEPSKARPGGRWSPESWRKALVHTFRSGRLGRLLEIWSSPDVDEGWRSEDLFDLWLFSHYAVSPPRTTVRHADELLASYPRNLHFHFIRGLALIRVPRPVEAAHAFARAARLEDDPVYRVASELAARFEVKLADDGNRDVQ